MCDALVAVDTGFFPGDEKLAVDLRGPSGLLGEIHGDGGVAVAAFQGIIGLQPRPFMLGQFKPMILKLLPCVDRAENLAPDFLRSLHLAGDLVGPVVRNMAVRTTGADARTVREVRGALQLLEHVVAHFVARGAELFGVGDLERGVESAPEQYAADEAAQRKETEAQMRAGAAGDVPE